MMPLKAPMMLPSWSMSPPTLTSILSLKSESRRGALDHNDGMRNHKTVLCLSNCMSVSGNSALGRPCGHFGRVVVRHCVRVPLYLFVIFCCIFFAFVFFCITLIYCLMFTLLNFLLSLSLSVINEGMRKKK